MSGIWTLQQGGTGLSSVSPNKIVGINSSSLTDINCPIPVTIPYGGLGISSANPSSFISTTSSTTAVSSSVAVPSGGPIDVDGAFTLTNKSLGSGTVFSAATPFIFGTAPNTVSISQATPSAQRTYTIKDMGSNSNFVLTQGTQTLVGKTITATTNNVTAKSLRTTGTSVAMGGTVAPTVGQTLAYNNATSTAFFKTPMWKNIWTTTTNTSYTNTTVANSLSGSTGVGSKTIAANTIVGGDKLRMSVRGFINNNTVNPLTLTFAVLSGATQLQTLTGTAAANTILTFYIDASIDFRAANSAFITMNNSYSSNVAASVNTALGNNTARTITTTVANTFDLVCAVNLTGTWTLTTYIFNMDYVTLNP